MVCLIAWGSISIVFCVLMNMAVEMNYVSVCLLSKLSITFPSLNYLMDAYTVAALHSHQHCVPRIFLYGASKMH